LVRNDRHHRPSLPAHAGFKYSERDRIPEQFNIASYTCDRWADADGARDAIVIEGSDGPEEYTFERLRERANQFANYLQAQELGPGDHVAVSGAQCVELLAANLACWKIGAVSVPISEVFSTDELRYRLEDSQINACVISSGRIESFRTVKGEISTLETTVVVGAEPESDESAFSEVVGDYSNEFETIQTDPEDSAIILYTSTVEPKGIVLPHQTLLGVLPIALCSLFNLEIHEEDVVRTPGEWSWAGTIFGAVLPALYYGVAVSPVGAEQVDPENELTLLESHQVTMFHGPATVYQMIMDSVAEDTDLSNLRTLSTVNTPNSLIERLQETFPYTAVHEVYGQSEAPQIVGDCEALGVEHRPGKMGKPGPGHQVQVVDPDTGEPIGTDGVGEFVLQREGDPVCFTEYWNKPEETAEKIRDGWQLSEDLGSIDEEGYLEVHGRKDVDIVSAGHHVSPTEIEDVIARHEAVSEVAITYGADSIRALIVLAEGYEPTEALREDLRSFMRENLEENQRPHDIGFISELPDTAAFRVDSSDFRSWEESTE